MQISYDWIERIDSTNSELKRRSSQSVLPEGYVVSANQQTAGRGRSGHSWQSPEGTSISTSMLLHPDTLPMEAVPRLTLLAAMATVLAIEEETGIESRIKWPNDIVIAGRKAAGILTEMAAEGGRARYVLVGIGINVHQRSYDPQIADKAISLDEAVLLRGGADFDYRGSVHADNRETGDRAGISHISRRKLIRSIWEHFSDLYREFSQTANLEFLLSDYNERLVNREQRVRVMDPAGVYEGICRGVNSRGELIVESEGRRRMINSGEVHVRGLYGYV